MTKIWPIPDIGPLRNPERTELMDNVQIITAILTLFAGIGVFLTACSMLSSNLETLGSSKLRDLFAAASKSKMLGVGIGALGTAAIQSSGAVTVIVIGFVNAGIMTLAQAATVIYGANIGTTITGQIVAWGISGEGGLSSTVIFSALAGVGAFIVSFASRDRTKVVGGILCGFGMLFVGLSMMSGAMESFAELDSVRSFLASINSIVLLVIIGAVLTAIIQSSSVMTSVAITMVVAGLITLDQGIYLTMGSNIGSCVVSVIAGMTGSANAKRASYIHLIFNVTGVVIFLLLGQAIQLVSRGTVTFGTIFGGLFPGMPQVQLAMFHTVFNVVAVVLILPLTSLLVALVTRMVADDVKPDTHLVTFYLDNNFLTSPPIAVQQIKSEIMGMAGIAMRNFESAIKMVCSSDYADRTAFDENEEELNYLNREIARFAARLFSGQLSESDSEYLSSALKSISDLERVGDYAKHIVEYGEELVSQGDRFSDTALDEISRVGNMVGDLFGQTMRAYENDDELEVVNAGVSAMAIADQTDEMSANHARRISEGKCSPDAGANYLALVSDVERVGAHFYNVAKTVRGL